MVEPHHQEHLPRRAVVEQSDRDEPSCPAISGTLWVIAYRSSAKLRRDGSSNLAWPIAEAVSVLPLSLLSGCVRLLPSWQTKIAWTPSVRPSTWACSMWATVASFGTLIVFDITAEMNGCIAPITFRCPRPWMVREPPSGLNAQSKTARSSAASPRVSFYI